MSAKLRELRIRMLDEGYVVAATTYDADGNVLVRHEKACTSWRQVKSMVHDFDPEAAQRKEEGEDAA